MTPGQERRRQIEAGLAGARARIEQARLAAGRSDDILLVVVTKTFPAGDVDLLVDLGVTDVGENRDQEARAKREQASCGDRVRWHMIGQLQRNKAASVSRWADVVESVDRVELATAFGRGAEAAGRTLEVLVQVNLDPEPRPDRGGAAPEQVAAIADAVALQPALRLRGVMGVAPYPGDPDDAFARLARVADAVRADHPDAIVVSAGMSGDLEQAIAHGATQVRVGGAVLGERPRVQ